MEHVDKETKAGLRLEIALLRGFEPIPTVTGLKLMKPQPRQSTFGPPQHLEAPDWPDDTAACFRLLRDFKALGDQVRITSIRDGWRCEIDTAGQTYAAEAETASLAICQAYIPARKSKS